MHVMTGQDVTPGYAKACFKSLNSLSEEMLNSLCRSLKAFCLWYMRAWEKEDIDQVMRVHVNEDTPPMEMLKNITPERLVISEKINAVSYYIGCSCDWENLIIPKENRSGLGIGIFNDKVFFVGTDMRMSVNDPNFNNCVNFAEGFKNY